MYTLKVEHSFDSAHFLYGYEGKCRNIHGHSYKYELEISYDASNIDSSGYLIDFGDIKKYFEVKPTTNTKGDNCFKIIKKL